MGQTVSHHHATGASSVRDASVRGANVRAIDAGAKPNSSNTWDDIQPSRDSRGHRLWPGASDSNPQTAQIINKQCFIGSNVGLRHYGREWFGSYSM